ncbi:hypothetical protein TcCL_ESM11713 [Trypanosoma cruzi]|nr:hypothetical protein TcCL_ESM11713 [Trypanosoma cruzi]
MLSAILAGSNHSRIAVQQNPCSHSIECWYGGGGGKQKKQRKGTGTRSSRSVIAMDRRRGVLQVCLPISAPTAASSSLGGGSTAPCAASAASGPLGPVVVAPPPAPSLAAPSPAGCPTTDVTPSAATSSLHGRSLFFKASCGAPAVSLGEITPLPVGASGATASPRATESSAVQPTQHPSVGCRGRSQCSPQQGRMPLAILVQ